MAMTFDKKAGTLSIQDILLNMKDPKVSSTGKTLLVATGMDKMVHEGKEIVVRYTATIKNPEYIKV